MAQKRGGAANGDDRRKAHWRSLALLPGAPDCVIKAAHRYFIEIHHPDRGGSVEDAQRINVAADEVRGRGVAPNEHVAQFFSGEPWHVLGVMANADRALAERAGRALTTELKTHPKLAAKVRWAVDHFGEVITAPPRIVPPPPPRPRVRPQRPAEPVRRPAPVPGTPDGLLSSVDFGTITWGSDTTRDLRLTWGRYAPYKIDADTDTPLRAEVKASKAVPGRFLVTLSIDWESPELAHDETMRGYNFSAPVRLHWPGGGEATVRASGVIRFPAVVTATPETVDFGSAAPGDDPRASFILNSSAATEVTFELSAWMRRVDSGGKTVTGVLALRQNTPVRIALGVDWAPILERAQAKLGAGTPVRPTGKIVVRWLDREVKVTAQIVVHAKPQRR